MRTLAEWSDDEVAAALAGGGLALDFGAARARLRADVPGLARAVRRVYGAFAHDADARFFEVTAALRRRAGPRRWLAPQIEFVADGEVLFEPFPAATHLPLLEWGMNLLYAQRLGHALLLHAGVVARGDRAVVLPALPGSGKSTLTVALALSGFRLLSDEFGVVGLRDGLLHALLRPAALKEASIEAIARYAPHAVLGPRFPGTRKGTVAHLAPDAASVAARHVPARPALLLFPQFVPGASVRVEPLTRARAFAKLAANAFNYEMLGPDGFDAVGDLVARSRAALLDYGDLAAAVAAVGTLLDGTP